MQPNVYLYNHLQLQLRTKDYTLVQHTSSDHVQWRIQQYAHDAVRTHWNID